MAEDKNTITVPTRLVNTRNVLIAIGVAGIIVGAVFIFFHKSKIVKEVATTV